MTEVTRILSALREGCEGASEELLPLVYQELRRLAARRLAGEAPGQTLQATDLVHEAFLRLVDVRQVPRWDTRGHFFAAAAEAMRRILVERARRRRAVKRGHGWQRCDLAGLADRAQATLADDDLLALDEALELLAQRDPRCAALVKLRYFAGQSIGEAARLLGVSPRTAKRDWTYARAWLRREIRRRNGLPAEMAPPTGGSPSESSGED